MSQNDKTDITSTNTKVAIKKKQSREINKKKKIDAEIQQIIFHFNVKQ